MREEEYLGRIKKLFSLIMPVGSVQALLGSGSPLPSTSANARAQVHVQRSSLDVDDTQLSTFYNRFCTLALAMRVLPSAENPHYRVSLARRVHPHCDASCAASARHGAPRRAGARVVCGDCAGIAD